MRVLALLRRHGFNTTSFQALEDGLEYWWFDEDAYADDGGAWVAAGAPIAAEDRVEVMRPRSSRSRAPRDAALVPWRAVRREHQLARAVG